jgi:streptomycin 6-kinase
MQAQIDAAARRWTLALDGPVHRSPTSCVAFGRETTGPGRHIVLKVADPESDETRGTAALVHFGGRGAVRVLAHEDGAVLLERAIPGRPLTAMVREGRDADAMRTVCDVAARLHDAPPPAGGFPTIEDWGRGFERHRRSGSTAIAPAMLDQASSIYTELAASQHDRRLLHGDLHHDNILWDEDRGWLAIDPKGVIGEPVYEVGAALRNPTSEPSVVVTAIARRCDIVAEHFATDRQRVIGWAFAQAVLSAVWSIEDRESPAFALAVAESFAALV